MIHKAKKSLGQNFLKSKPALAMMCEAGGIQNTDTIVEIGPGKGALTEKLLEKTEKVIAIEKDQDLIEFLKEKFANEIKSGKLVLINDDCLKFEPTVQVGLGQYKIIANIPYNITGAILKKFLSEDLQPERMVLLVQKEVADRIVARAHGVQVRLGQGKESILSLSVKAYGTPKYIMKVGKRFFSPSPKVDSAIISITNISKENFKNKNEEHRFFEIIKAGFAHKRKVLIKNLESILTKEQILSAFSELEIDSKSRAEDIPISKWLKLSKISV